MVVGELAHEKDIVIIGGGPGGYHAAIRAAQLGRKVTLIEKNQLGGVCLNEGCIPSKIVTAAASKMSLFKDSYEMGIGDSNPLFNYSKLRDYQSKTIEKLQDGIQALIQANKVEFIRGKAYFLTNNRLGVETEDCYDVFQFNHAIIATGAKPNSDVNGIIPDGDKIFHSGMLMQMTDIPKHLLIYGSNETALEMASAFQTFGSEVTLLLEREGFELDSSVEKELKRLLKKRKIQVLRKTTLIGIQKNLDDLQVEVEFQDERISINASHLLVATPFIPNTEDLGLERIGVSVTKNGSVEINKRCQTSQPAIYAVGDVTDGPALAVKAITQGKVAAEAICGRLSEYDPCFLPKVVHFQPPIASVGLTEEIANEQGISIKVGQFPLASNGYATLLGKKDGFVKVISELETETLLGVHMVGEGAIELVTSGIISLEMVARLEDLRFPFYPHPSINEGLLEAIESIEQEAIHIPPRKSPKKVTTK
jgi:dihydrolipoamide dehydrogenase